MSVSEPHDVRHTLFRAPWTAALCALALSASALAGPQSPAASEDPVVLRVGETEVRASEYARWMILNHGAGLARTFANDWIVHREADRLGIEIEPEEVSARLDEELNTRIENAFLGQREDWIAELERTGRSEQGLRRQRLVELEPYLEAEAICARDRVVPPLKIEREWELLYGRNGRAYDVLLMKFQVEFLTPPTGTPRDEAERLRQAEIDEQLERAQRARERIVAGAAFEDVAAEESDDLVTRANRGRLPAGFHHVGWPDGFLDALETLGPGSLSEPLYARGGWWLVKLLDVTVTPLDQVRERIELDLLERGPGQDEVGAVRSALMQDLEVEVPETLFDFEAVSAEAGHEVVGLVINGEPVSRVEYLRWMMDVRGESSAQHFAEHFVVLDRARSLGLEVGEEELRQRSLQRIERMIVMSYKGDREAWRAHLAALGRDEGSFLRDLMVRMRIQLLTEQLMMRDRKITDEDVRRRWEDVYGPGGQRLEVRVLLVNVELPLADGDITREELQALAQAAREEAEREARKLAERLENGEDFAALARMHSDEPTTAENGGLLPDRFRAKHWPQEVGEAVAALAPGETFGPTDLGTAWALFQLVGRETVEYDDVAAELRGELESDPPSYSNLALYRNKLLLERPLEVLPGMHE